MKLGSYLFGLSLAVTAGVTPADAYQVRFPHNLVANTCPHVTITIYTTQQQIVLKPTERETLVDSLVTLLEDESGYHYLPTMDQTVNEYAPCYINLCRAGELISMSCFIQEHPYFVNFEAQ
jgi:hypothetical protein